MRKIRLGFISPYVAMVPLIEELNKGNDDFDIIVQVGNLEAGVNYALAMEKQGIDILISRGGTANLVREAVSVPVIDVHISGYDLLRSIMLANGYSDEKKALVGFSNITLGAASIVSLLDIEMEVVTLKEATEVEAVLLKLKEEGYKSVLGDVVTVEAAGKLGMNGLLLQSGKESILESFQEAKRIFKSQKDSQQLLRVMRNLLKIKKQDIVILSKDGRVLFENWVSFSESPLSSADLQEIHQQVLEKEKTIVKMADKNGVLVEIQADRMKDRDGDVFIYALKHPENYKAVIPGMHLEHISLLPSLVTESPAMKGIKKLIEEPAMAKEALLLEGEIGTGKKEIVRYLHHFHQKRGAIIHLSLEEFETFPPRFDIEEASTLLIELKSKTTDDQIVSVRSAVSWAQGKNVQVIFAGTKISNEFLMEAGISDAMRIILPSLAERKEDIPFLVRQFLLEFHQSLGTQAIKVREDAMDQLKQTEWPGNLMDLKMYVKKLALVEKDYVIEKTTLLSIPFYSASSSKEPKISYGNQSLKEIEQQIIEQVLKEEDFNQTKTAQRLGINRATLWRKLNK